MKQLIVIRHAKSSWDSALITDFDRPLNDRGKRDAPEMAGRLIKRKVTVDLFITSSANRAQTTARIFMDQMKSPPGSLELVPELYLAPKEVFYGVIKKIDNRFQHVAVFGHNPGITDFVNSLTGMRTDNVPTCGVMAVAVNTNDWQAFDQAEKQLLFYDYPKQAH